MQYSKVAPIAVANHSVVLDRASCNHTTQDGQEHAGSANNRTQVRQCKTGTCLAVNGQLKRKLSVQIQHNELDGSTGGANEFVRGAVDVLLAHLSPAAKSTKSDCNEDMLTPIKAG